MNIRSESGYLNSFWDWSFLNNCFGSTGIKISDIDGIVERKGKFLLLETKSVYASPMSKGQWLTLDALHRTGLFTIVILWGDDNIPERLKLWNKEEQMCSRADVQDLVSSWFLYANSRSTEGFEYVCHNNEF